MNRDVPKQAPTPFSHSDPRWEGNPARAGTRSQRGMFRRLLVELRPSLGAFFLLLIVNILAVPLALVSPLPIKMIVDNVLGSQPFPGFLRIFVPDQSPASKDYVIMLAVVILLGSTVLVYLQNLLNIWSTNTVGNRMTLDMRDRLFRQMQRLSIVYHDTKGTADSTYRV